MTRYLMIAALLLTVGCWRDAVHRAAGQTTVIDEQYSGAYLRAHDECLVLNETRAGYNECMEPWDKGAAHIARLREVTLGLDFADSRKGRKAAACEWYKAVERIHKHTPLPATHVALTSKWRRKC